MKKEKLIELLLSIEGNPEVKIYNGYVEDYMGIHDPRKVSIHRMSNKKRIRLVNLERESEGLLPTNKLEKEDEWKLIKENYDDESKSIILLQPKTRGLVSYGADSSGDLKY